MATLPEEIQAIVERLPPDYHLRLLEYARELVQMPRDGRPLPRSPLPPGTPGKALIDLKIKLPLEEVEAMERAIMEGCEWTPDFR